VTIAIVSLLATVVTVSLDPVGRFQQARDTTRWTDVSSISTAIHEYIVDNDGSLPTGVSTTEQQLGECASGGASACAGAADACLDLSVILAKYLKSIPLDPSGGTLATTGYSVVADSNNIITVTACAAEIETIEMSK